MTISVQDDLKGRMDKAKRLVNWSAVATKAFEQKLHDISDQLEQTEMEAVIQRLKASKATGESAMEKDARDGARHWAMHQAKAAQLKALSDARDQMDDRGWECTLDDHETTGASSVYSPGQHFYMLITPDWEDTSLDVRQDAEQFWWGILGDCTTKANEGTYILAFAESAIEFWNEVADKL